MEDNIGIECCCQVKLSAVLSFRLPPTVELVHKSDLNVHFCPFCHFLLIHLVFDPETFPSGIQCLAGKVALKSSKSTFQSQSCTKAGMWSVLGGFPLLVLGGTVL